MGFDEAMYLGLVLDLHICGGEQLGVDTLRQARKNVYPRGPDRQAECKGPSDTEDGIPNHIPQERIKEKEREIHEVHDGESECGLVGAQSGPEDRISTSLDDHTDHGKNGVAEGQCEEEVGFGKLATENENPHQDRRHSG